MKDQKEFLQLLKKLRKELNEETTVYSEDGLDLWCPDFAKYADSEPNSNISPVEKELLTTYRTEFIAWLRLQQ
jgi:hypothetical protein